MINKLDIKGFKSIRELHLDCKRINLFIGEPNTGKSNILEALGFLSWCARGGSLVEYVRLEKLSDLFYDGITSQGNWALKLRTQLPTAYGCQPAVHGFYDSGQFRFGTYLEGPPFFNARYVPGLSGDPAYGFNQTQFGFIHFYRFQTLTQYPSDDTNYLQAPKGENLAALLRASKEIGRLAREYFTPSGLLLVVKPQEQKIEIQKQAEGVALSFPYSISSDTLQRMIFYMAAIESNKNATLVFEEPEVHSFPYYVKHLGERIAMDENNNQYFIATHNPYLLTAIWEKSSADDVAVFATYYRNYETRVKALTEEDMASLMEGDPFFGVSHLVKDAP